MFNSIARLAKPLFRPSTSIFEVGAYLGFPAMLDLEPAQPVLYVGSGKDYSPRQPTETEVSVILGGLEANPPHPAELTPLDILARFTDDEQDAIETSFPRFARQLFAATGPVAWATFVDSVSRLRQAGLLTTEQEARITGPQDE